VVKPALALAGRMAQACRVKWLLILSFFVVGCASEAPTSVPGGFGSGVGSGNGGGGGEGGEGGVGGGGGRSAGACDNEADLGLIDGTEDSLRNIAHDCGIFNCGNRVGLGDEYESCVTTCIDDAVQDLSPACIACYAGVERCSHDALC
jgi:hypothetical protein